jgi:hypothetical protein
MSKPSFDLKLDWANEHFRRVKACIEQFLAPKNKAYEITPDEHGEPSREYWLTLRKEPPDEIALVAGDVLHNARSALDHIIYASSTRKDPAPRKTGFPIHTHKVDWDRKDKRGRLVQSSGKYQVRLLPDHAQKIIRDLQPWQGIDPLHWDRGLVRVLHDLDIADKHKKLNFAVAYVNVTAVGFPKGASLPRRERVASGPLQLNTPFRIVRFTAPPKVNVHLIPTLDVTFSEGGTPEEPLVGKLSELLGCVERILGQLRPFV